MATIAEQWAGVSGLVSTEERAKLERVVGLLQRAYYEGPFELPPQELARQLREVDPYMIQDYLQQMGWDVVGYSFEAGAERNRSVKESRRLFRYSPMAQWSIWLWTSWGLGENVTVKIDDENANEVFAEFWAADRNQATLAADCVHELSNWLLVDGNQFLPFYASTVDGQVTIGEIDPEEITEIIHAPGQAKRPVFYKRQWTDKATSKTQTWYYPDWQEFLRGTLDEPWQGGSETLAQKVLPSGAYRADLGRAMGGEHTATLGEPDEGPKTGVCMLHLGYNRKERASLWGWPLLTTASPWLKAHKRFMEAQLAVAEAKAMYVRRYKVKGGSRAVDAVKDIIASNLSQTSTAYDTNPPASPGSSEVMNRAIDVEDLPMSTGAGDARTNNEMFSWHGLLGAGLFPSSAGLDVMRYATALAMDKAQSMLFTRYQTYWSAQLRKMARIVISFKERYGGLVVGDWSADVSVDTFSLSDFPDVAKTLGPLVNSMLVPLVEGGVMSVPAARGIMVELWRVTLQALGVAGLDELVSDEAFSGPALGTVEESLTRAVELYRAGDISADKLAEYAIAEWAEGLERHGR